jgi:hypothetical protein
MRTCALIDLEYKNIDIIASRQKGIRFGEQKDVEGRPPRLRHKLGARMGGKCGDLNNIYKFSSYLTGHILRLRYKAQPIF